MSRITFYRKYRSQHFKELVGQEHIVQTLTNAITNQRLSHAYIFSGPRGTGKTSVARIFAKAVNTFEKENQLDTLDNEICNRISAGICVDIIEIDAASNTGVDNIRDLKDNINFSPVECSYKFYIIDEVHMLSSGAFNALLKTLEEPPIRTIFVLATTEPQKIPITIHSRCQHLRFRNLTEQEIKQQLLEIAQKESMELADDAAAILARNASGCMRDGLSLLDQIYSFTGSAISAQDVNKILGSCTLDHLFQLLDALFLKQSDKVLSLLNEVLKAGINPAQLLKDIMFVAEQVLMMQSDCKDYVTIESDILNQLTKKATLDQTINLLDCLAKIESETRWFLNPGLLLQIRLMQFVNSDKTSVSNNDSVSKIEASQNSVSTKPPISSNQEKNSDQKAQPNQQHAHKPINQKEFRDKISIPTPENESPKKIEINQDQTQKVVVSQGNNSSSQIKEHEKPVMDVSGQDISMVQIQQQWPSLLEKIKNDHLGLYTILRSSQVISLDHDKINLKLDQNIQFFIEKLEEESYQKTISTYLQSHFNKALTLNVLGMEEEAVTIEMVSAVSEAVTSTPSDDNSEQEITLPKSNTEHSINDIVSLFEGKLL